jgi:tetratricopeptide (TPR) repeat protein
MSHEARVQQLLEEIFESDRTPEEVCRDFPELLPEVRKRWQQMRRTEEELDVLFPAPGASLNPDILPLLKQGALAYRAGRFQDAVLLFERSLKADAKPGRAVLNWLWLALANHRLGNAEESRRWLTKAQAWLDQFRDSMPARADGELGLHYHNWLEAHVLRREAEALIQSPNP